MMTYFATYPETRLNAKGYSLEATSGAAAGPDDKSFPEPRTKQTRPARPAPPHLAQCVIPEARSSTARARPTAAASGAVGGPEGLAGGWARFLRADHGDRSAGNSWPRCVQVGLRGRPSLLIS